MDRIDAHVLQPFSIFTLLPCAVALALSGLTHDRPNQADELLQACDEGPLARDSCSPVPPVCAMCTCTYNMYMYMLYM